MKSHLGVLYEFFGLNLTERLFSVEIMSDCLPAGNFLSVKDKMFTWVLALRSPAC